MIEDGFGRIRTERRAWQKEHRLGLGKSEDRHRRWQKDPRCGLGGLRHFGGQKCEEDDDYGEHHAKNVLEAMCVGLEWRQKHWLNRCTALRTAALVQG